MIGNFFVIAYRNLMRNKLFIAINIIGMGIAIACCVTAYLNWQFAARWDEGHSHAEEIYRVQSVHAFDGEEQPFGMVPMPLAAHVRQSIQDVDKVVRYMVGNSDVRVGDDVYRQRIAYADAAFVDMFSLALIGGTNKAFADKSKIFISDELALKYFERTDVTGSMLTLIETNAVGMSSFREFQIGGVFRKLPSNSSFDFQIITLIDNFWPTNTSLASAEMDWKTWTHVLFLQVDSPEKVPAITSQLQQYVEFQNLAREDFKLSRFYLQPFVGMMRKNNNVETRLHNDYLKSGLIDAAIIVPAVMSLLLLMLACFNFTNTSISIAGKRLKEIGIRKVIGGTRQQLIIQFMGESIFLCSLGMAAGLLIAEWLVPAYDSLWYWLDLKLDYTENGGFLFFLFLLLLTTALVAGSYPALYITSFEPVSVLKGKSKFGGTNWFTNALLGGQFVISVLALIMAIAFYHNGEYQKNYNLGYATHGVIAVPVNSERDFSAYRDALEVNKNITMIAGTRHHIANSWIKSPVSSGVEKHEVDILDVGSEYFDLMGMTLQKGRKFEANSETDRKESVMVTEEFIRQFGWKDDPIGKKITLNDTTVYYVVGVAKDIYARALWVPIEPLMMRYVDKSDYRQLLVKADVKDLSSVNVDMEHRWKQLFPNAVYEGKMIDEEMQETNEINRNISSMFGFLGFFSALMTGIGLFTLVSLNLAKSMKEIGVRKTLGASVSSIIWVVNKKFVINLVIASLAGSAAGYFVAEILMSILWEYYQSTTLITILFSIGIMSIVVCVTVGHKTIVAATASPLKALRDE